MKNKFNLSMIMKRNKNINLLFVFIGFCVSIIPWFHTWRQHILSEDKIFDFKNYRSNNNHWIIIKKEYFIFYCLNYAYEYNYLIYKYRKYSNTKWQEIHWNDYAEFYSKARSLKKNVPRPAERIGGIW